MQSRQTKHSSKVGALLVFLAIFWPAATVGTAPARSARDCPHPHGTGLPFRRLQIPERARLAVPSQHMWMDRRLSADIMYSQAGLSYMKEGLASNGPARIL
jgi:hypothetical protein